MRTRPLASSSRVFGESSLYALRALEQLAHAPGGPRRVVSSLARDCGRTAARAAGTDAGKIADIAWYSVDLTLPTSLQRARLLDGLAHLELDRPHVQTDARRRGGVTRMLSTEKCPCSLGLAPHRTLRASATAQRAVADAPPGRAAIGRGIARAGRESTASRISSLSSAPVGRLADADQHAAGRQLEPAAQRDPDDPHQARQLVADAKPVHQRPQRGDRKRPAMEEGDALAARCRACSRWT